MGFWAGIEGWGGFDVGTCHGWADLEHYVKVLLSYLLVATLCIWVKLVWARIMDWLDSVLELM